MENKNLNKKNEVIRKDARPRNTHARVGSDYGTYEERKYYEAFAYTGNFERNVLAAYEDQRRSSEW